jgi:putative membrane protein
MHRFLVLLSVFSILLLVGCSDTMNSNNSVSNSNSNSHMMANTNPATSASPVSSALSAADHKFVNEAAAGGMAEVELGRLAFQKAQNPAVKEFGEKMIADHSKANDELKSIAQRKGVTLPPGPNDEQRKEMDRLSKLSGAAFDREYMKLMVADHDQDVKAFEDEARNGADPDIKAFASKTLSVVQEHQKMAHDINAKLK